jgi:hypothetical protein
MLTRARRGLKRLVPLAASLAVGSSMLLASAPARAIETGGAPQLPPPPPPPPTQSTPAPAGGGASPAPKPSAGGPTRVMTTPTSTSSSSSVSESSGDSASGGALDTRWAIAGMLGVSTDCLGFGLGLRGGKTFDNHIYVGGSFVYHFMSCGNYAYGPVGNGYSVSASTFYFGPEAGYDFDLKAVVLRAYMGLGAAFYSGSVTGPGVNVSASQNEFVVWPGASVFWDVPSSPWFIGGDVRFVSVWNGPAVGFFFTGGLHLGS